MSRRSSRAVPASAAPAAPAPKRRASARLSTTSLKPEPKKQKPNASTTSDKPVRSTTKKSKYFENQSSDGAESVSDPSSEPEEPTSSEQESEEPPTDDEAPTRAKPKPTKKQPQNKASAVKNNGNAKNTGAQQSPESDEVSLEDKQLWKEGVRVGLGPGKEVFIKKPRARDPGDTPYRDHTLHPNTFLFLKDLAENNDRAWLKAHDPDFRTSKKDWESFVETFSEKVSEIDATIPELPAKDLIFRIHRDIRFSKDPTPYKTHFSAAWSRTGKKGDYAAYYVHCQPGSCMVGAGLWHPNANELALLREEIDHHSQRLKSVLNDEKLCREFLNGASDEDGALKAFLDQNKESALKTKPMGYTLDNENIQLIRLRSFTIGKPLADEELLGPNAQEKIASLIGILEPFVTYLNSVVRPDPVGLHDNSEPDDTE